MRTAVLGLAAATIGLGLADASVATAPAAAPAPTAFRTSTLPPPFASSAQAGPSPVLLGAADRFPILAATTITNTGPSVINGDLGLHPGSAVVGFPPGTVNGTRHVGDAVAKQANTDLATAYKDAAGRASTATSPPDLGGQTLTAGVYRTGAVASVGLTGKLTLDARGDPRAVFIFQTASTLVTASDSSVSLVNGAQACNVFWQVGSSATLRARTEFNGNILALTSISAGDGANVNGGLLARNGAVTLIDDTVTRSPCAPTTAPALRALEVKLSKPAVIGRRSSFVIQATDTRAPISGMSVQFGSGGDMFGSSACRPADSDGNIPRAFRPGARTRLTAPHRFRKKGVQKVLVRVDSGGCSAPLSSFYQTVTITPTKPGQKPKPVTMGKPTLVKPRGNLFPPVLPPGPVGGAPGLRIPAADARSKGGCKSAGTRLGRSNAARKSARRALLCLLNKTRRSHGLSSLRGNQKLLRAAEAHSVSMVRQHFFSHVEPSGLSPLQRILNAGYLTGAHNFVYGENIGFGEGPTSSPASMMRAWMNSSPHRANILTGRFREVGLGIVAGVPGRSSIGGGTYTTVFGLRR
jgi:uncharacterized protein YkwD